MEERIEDLRGMLLKLHLNLSFRELSTVFGLSAATLCRFANGKTITVENLSKLDNWAKKHDRRTAN